MSGKNVKGKLKVGCVSYINVSAVSHDKLDGYGENHFLNVALLTSY